jgi:antitoxin (DNA-binding transcriptional repressor) of toxin-antitoxin stability system
MKTVGILGAKTWLVELVRDAEGGTSTTILRNGKPVARIVPIEHSTSRVFGFDDGLGYISDNFDAPLPSELLKAFYGGRSTSFPSC